MGTSNETVYSLRQHTAHGKLSTIVQQSVKSAKKALFVVLCCGCGCWQFHHESISFSLSLINIIWKTSGQHNFRKQQTVKNSHVYIYIKKIESFASCLFSGEVNFKQNWKSWKLNCWQHMLKMAKSGTSESPESPTSLTTLPSLWCALKCPPEWKALQLIRITNSVGKHQNERGTG